MDALISAVRTADEERVRAPRHYPFLILALIALSYALVPFGPLIFDDVHAVSQNTALRTLWNIPAFFVDPDLFSASAGRMYRPLVLTTLTIDHAVGAGAPWAFKVGNLLQHLAVCALLFLVLPRLFRRARLSGTLARRATWIAVLFYGLHPLHVETLCLVSSRSEVLCAIGLLVGLQGSLRAGDRGRVKTQGAWLAAGTAIACLSKETGVLVPVIAFLVEVVLPPRRGPRLLDLRALVIRFAPALPVAAAYLFLRKALFGVATMSIRTMHTGGDPWSGGSRDLATQLEGMALYLPQAVGLWLWPASLSLDHTRFLGLGFSAPSVLAGILFVAAMVVLALLLWRRRPLLTLGVLGALIIASPWILVPLNVPFAEHRLYVPLLFFTIPAAAFCARAARQRAVLLPGLAVAALLLGARSVRQQHAWLSLRGIWSVTLASNPESFRAWTGLADAAIERGDLWQAVNYLERSRAIYPRYAPGEQNLREMRVRLLESAKTDAFAARALRLAEQWAEERFKDPFARLLAARARRGHYRFSGDEADLRWGLSWALSCLAMVEPKMLVYRTAAEVLRIGGHMDEALALFDASAERGLSNLEFLCHKAEILIAAKQLDECRPLIRGLTAEDPFDARVLTAKLRLHAAAGEAAEWAQTAGVLRRLGYDTSSLPRPR